MASGKLDDSFFGLGMPGMGTVSKLTQRYEFGSNWTALKLPVVGTR